MVERDRNVDRGFTLIEVVIVTVLIGLMSLVIGFAITTVLRVTPTADSQVTNARSVQGLSAWFPDDAASAIASNANVSPNPVSLKCAGSEAAPGVNLVEFNWTVAEPSTTTFVAAYRLEPDGTNRAVRRYECSGTGAPPFVGTTAQKLTGPLADVATVTANAPGFDRITLELQALDGSAIRIEATPRSPAAALPATTVPATVPPPTACAVQILPPGPNYGPVGLYGLAHSYAEKLTAEVEPNFLLSGDTCGVLTIEYDTGYETKSRPINVSWPNGDAIIPNGDGDNDPVTGTARWTPGFKTIEVYNNGVPLTTPSTATLEVSP